MAVLDQITSSERALEKAHGDKLKSGVGMAYPASPYIEERNGGLYVAGTGVSLDSVVIWFQQGASPEKIVQSFPTRLEAARRQIASKRK
jgi:hypothetical protein